jgi:hypothetical protein
VNDGAGSFDAAPFRDLRRIEAITDLDLDGRLDLAVTQYPPYFGLPRVWILHASGPVSPPTFVGDVQNWVGRLALGTISVGNLASADCPDPGYPDLLYMGCCSISPWLTMNGDETSISSWGSGIFDFQIPFIEPFCRVGDLNLDGRDDFLSGRTGVFVKLCIVHTKVGPLAFDGFEARTQVLPPGQLVDLDQDGDLDLLGEQVVRNRTIP